MACRRNALKWATRCGYRQSGPIPMPILISSPTAPPSIFRISIFPHLTLVISTSYRTMWNRNGTRCLSAPIPRLVRARWGRHWNSKRKFAAFITLEQLSFDCLTGVVSDTDTDTDTDTCACGSYSHNLNTLCSGYHKFPMEWATHQGRLTLFML